MIWVPFLSCPLLFQQPWRWDNALIEVATYIQTVHGTISLLVLDCSPKSKWTQKYFFRNFCQYCNFPSRLLRKKKPSVDSSLKKRRTNASGPLYIIFYNIFMLYIIFILYMNIIFINILFLFFHWDTSSVIIWSPLPLSTSPFPKGNLTLGSKHTM